MKDMGQGLRLKSCKPLAENSTGAHTRMSEIGRSGRWVSHKGSPVLTLRRGAFGATAGRGSRVAVRVDDRLLLIYEVLDIDALHLSLGFSDLDQGLVHRDDALPYTSAGILPGSVARFPS